MQQIFHVYMTILSTSDWYTFAATTVEDGDFRVPDVDQAEQHAALSSYVERLSALLRANDHEMQRYAIARLCHGIDVQIVTPNSPSFFMNTDGLIASVPHTAVVVTGADCPPVFVADGAHHVIGLAHSGRKGTVGNIASVLVHRMMNEFGSQSSDLQAVIGPGICGRHYEVAHDVARTLENSFPDCLKPSTEAGRVYLDLRCAIRAQLVRGGLRQDRVTILSDCTYECLDRWFSWRRNTHEGKTNLQAQAFVAIVHGRGIQNAVAHLARPARWAEC